MKKCLFFCRTHIAVGHKVQGESPGPLRLKYAVAGKHGWNWWNSDSKKIVMTSYLAKYEQGFLFGQILSEEDTWGIKNIHQSGSSTWSLLDRNSDHHHSRKVYKGAPQVLKWFPTRGKSRIVSYVYVRRQQVQHQRWYDEQLFVRQLLYGHVAIKWAFIFVGRRAAIDFSFHSISTFFLSILFIFYF